MQKRRRWQQTVLSNQRHDLLRRDQEGHEIDQANEPQNDKTRQPIRRRLRLACPQRRAKRVVRLTAASTVAAWRRGRYRVTFVTTGGSLLHATKLLLAPGWHLAILQVARSGRLCRDAQDMPRSRLPSGASQRFSPVLRERSNKTGFRGRGSSHFLGARALPVLPRRARL